MTRKRVAIILLVAAAVPLLWAFLTSDHEPRYQDRKLSDWLAIYGDHNQNPPATADAAKAIHGIGTNALPFLVRWLTHNPPGWRRTISRIALSVGGDRAYRYAAPEFYRVTAALNGFHILGAEAAL